MSDKDKAMTSHPVEILPLGATITVPDGQALMPSAVELGYRWPNICKGQASCGVCWVVVEDGMEHASAIERDEQVRLDVTGKSNDPTIRLACQMRVGGPMVVRKRGVALPKQDD